MRSFPDFYPASPRRVPVDLAEPSERYRGHINTVSVALTAFFALYFAFVTLLLTLSIVAFSSAGLNPKSTRFPALLKIVVGVGAATGAGFLIRALFLPNAETEKGSIEIFAEEHPKLFRFLECVCEEVEAPMPERVFVNADVNAAAGSDVTIMSLFRKPDRKLFIGLGLVNVLNMTEFKALLAHEFAHLSQHDAPSAPYVRLGMRVAGTLLSRYKALEWIFMQVVKLNLKLSREMEYHADLTATTVTGSDAVPQLLYKCLWAEHCMQQTISDLDRAREHGLYSTDVLVHQLLAGKQIRKRRKDSTFGADPVLPNRRDETVQIFTEDEDEQAAMWQEHPSNHLRELNCKARYIRTDFDDQTAWALFGQVPQLRRNVSAKFYRQVFREKKAIDWTEARKVQTFLDEEYAETNLDIERYGVLYHYRNLQPLDLKTLTARSEKNRNAPADLVHSHLSLYSDAVKKFAKTHVRHMQEMQLLVALNNKWLLPKKNRFRFRGKQMKKSSAKELIKQVGDELKDDNHWLAEFDTRVFVTYYELALEMDPQEAAELVRRYRFQYVLQNLWVRLRKDEDAIDFVFGFLSRFQNMQLDPRSFALVLSILRQAHDTVSYVLDQAELAKFPALANMPHGEPVRPYLLKGELPKKPGEFNSSLKVVWLKKFTNKLLEVRKRVDRLHYKNLGALLALQEQIGAEAVSRWG